MGGSHKTIIAGLGVIILMLLVIMWQTRGHKSGFRGGDQCGGCPPGTACLREDGGLGPAYYACQ